MATYSDFVRDDHGNLINGATVYVYNFAGSAVTTVTSGVGGTFRFNADDGIYALETHFGGRVVRSLAFVGDVDELYRGQIPAGTLGTAGITFVTPQQYLATGDGITNDGLKVVNALAALKDHAVNDDGGTKGSQPLFVPASKYYMGTTTLEITHSLLIYGHGSGQSGGLCSLFSTAAGATCLRVQRSTTSGDRIVGASHSGGDGTILNGLAGVGPRLMTNADFHFIDSNARVFVQNCRAIGYQGNGLNIAATAGGGDGKEGNANGFAVQNFRAEQCQYGVRIGGNGANADVNAGYTLGIDTASNRLGGLRDDAFLGNTHIAPQAANPAGPDYWFTNDNANHLILGPYAEGGGQTSQFSNLALRVGGTLASGFAGGGHIYMRLVNDTPAVTAFPQLTVESGNNTALNVTAGGTGQSRLNFNTGSTLTAQIVSGDGRLYHSVSSGFHDFRITDAQVLTVNATNTAPGSDNAITLGTASKRWSTVYAGTGTINTSDRNHKTQVRPLSGAEFDSLLDAVASVPIVAFKFIDAIEQKGPNARDHYGIIAQDLADALTARGLNPFTGGVLGRDPVFEVVEELQDVEQPVTETVTFENDVVEVVDGRAVQRTVTGTREEVVYDELPLFDEAGNRMMSRGRPATDTEPELPPRPLTHRVVRMETVPKLVEVRRPKLDAEGEQEWLWSVRYDEFWALRFASFARAA